MSVANQRSTPVGAKVNGSQNRVKKRYFATLSMTGSAGSTAISLLMSNKTLMTYLETFCLEIKNKLLKITIWKQQK